MYNYKVKNNKKSRGSLYFNGAYTLWNFLKPSAHWTFDTTGGDPDFMKRLLPYVSEAGYVTYQAQVEAALVRTLANYGVCSSAIADEGGGGGRSRKRRKEVYEEQSRIRHNIRSLVNVIRRKISPEARPYVHLFATSADILDTATSLRFKALTEKRHRSRSDCAGTATH